MKQLFCLSLLIGFCALIGKGWHVAKDGFQIRRTVCQLPKKMAAAPDMSTINALDQTYTYLGRGHQCYAFASEDGRFVIKLPRQDRYRLSFFLRACPISCLTKEREAVRSDLLARQDFLSQSFEIAFEDLREETALLYLHLNETDCFSRPLLIKDRLGRSYTLDPNRTAFLLQEKKPIMMESFQKCLEMNDRKGAEKILEAFVRLISTRAEKGIYNKDPSFVRNFGWDGQKGIQTDVGSFYKKPQLPFSEAREKSFQETENHVRNWLKEIDLEMLQIFDQKTEMAKNSWKHPDQCIALQGKD